MSSKPLDHSFISAMRERIETATLVDKLQAHVKDPGKAPLSMTQLKAADILLRKSIPDLKAIEHSGEINKQRVEDMSDAELADIAAGRRERAVTAPGSTH